MKEKFVPYEKMSKKAKKEFNKRKRVMWMMNPVTRKPAKPSAYNRAKIKKENSCNVDF